MDKTKNYNLLKPTLTDPADITQLSGNFDVVDTELKKQADKDADLDQKKFDKAGGTVEGEITVNGGIKLPTGGVNFATADMGLSQVDTGIYMMFGGEWAKNGAGLALNRKTASGQEGHFVLNAANGANTKELRGNPNGTLSWDGKNIVLSINGTNADAGGNVTLDIKSQPSPEAYNGNLNNLKTSGIYKVENPSAGGYPAYDKGFLWVYVGSTRIVQTFTNEFASLMYRRAFTISDGTWSTWYADTYSVNGIKADDKGNVDLPVATAEQYGLVRVAKPTDVLDTVQDAAITPAVYHDVSDFRHKGTAYSLGDKVECMFNHELFLECTKAGTTASTPLDTRNVKHGQVLTDGGVQWTVRTHIKSVNGKVAMANGNVEIEIPNREASTGEALKNLPAGAFVFHGLASTEDADKVIAGTDYNGLHIYKNGQASQLLFAGNKVYYRLDERNSGAAYPSFNSWQEFASYNASGHLVLPNGAEFWIA